MQVLLLNDGTETAGGKQQFITKINVHQANGDTGLRGMDKLIVNPRVKTNIMLEKMLEIWLTIKNFRIKTY